jgi:hypothetical protein
MHKYFSVILACLIIVSCNHGNSPVKVKDKLNFGIYSISPPKGYWYFPGKCPEKFNTEKDFCIITFYEDKATALKARDFKKHSSTKSNPDELKVMFNFSLGLNNYKNFDEYYNKAQSKGIKYDEVPCSVNILKSVQNWSCKQTTQGFYNIECIALGENLVSISILGNNGADVLTKIPMLKDMMNSFFENRKR